MNQALLTPATDFIDRPWSQIEPYVADLLARPLNAAGMDV